MAYKLKCTGLAMWNFYPCTLLRLLQKSEPHTGFWILERKSPHYHFLRRYAASKR